MLTVTSISLYQSPASETTLMDSYQTIIQYMILALVPWNIIPELHGVTDTLKPQLLEARNYAAR